MMQSHLREALGTFHELHVPFGVLCFQLEGLARFRTSFGQEAASTLLRMVAHDLENTLWKTDFVGRWADDQFLVASKFRIVSNDSPPPIPFFGRERSPRFRRFVVDTPLGAVTFYSLHTVSPRGGFYNLRGQGLRREILSGRLFSGGAAKPEIRGTAALRMLQVKAMAQLARAEKGPVMIVGDGNLPTLSDARARYLGDFHDGFAEAGLGFGYSYPSTFPWMRIDMLLSNDQLAFKRVEVGRGRASDHLCVFGDVVRR